MQGAGNDFVVISPFFGSAPVEKLSRSHLKFIANRHYGVGADQILTVKTCMNQEAQYEFKIINSDGTEVEQCGNGARCVTRFLFDLGMLSGKETFLKSKAGVIKATVLDDLNIQVQMTVPKFNTVEVGLKKNLMNKQKINKHEIFLLPYKQEVIKIFLVSMGNPHAVLYIDTSSKLKIEEIAKYIAVKNFFSYGINLGFSKVINKKKIDLRVFERGAGETLACGSGACAAVVAGVAQGFLEENFPVEVNLPGGKLSISWSGNLSDCVYMSGPAREVFRGTIQL